MYQNFDLLLEENDLEFTVGGQLFTAKADLPWKKYSLLILSMVTGGTGAGEDGINKTEEFFRVALTPESREPFLALINNDGDDGSPTISPKQVSAILDWLLNYHTGKLAATNGNPSLPSSPDTGEHVVTVSLDANPN